MIEQTSQFYNFIHFLDWYFNDKNNGRLLAHIMPELLKAEAEKAAGGDDEDEEDDDE
jgi:hypothetical protein